MISKTDQKGKSVVETPLMKQYFSIKAKYPDAMLLFRVGDFYETFEEDAVKASGILGIVLTRRANGAASYVELAGFPHHSLDTYLPKLVRAGLRVAICDQLEDPKLTKKIVKRGVTELVTPGVSLNEKVLDHKSNNFLASVNIQPKISGVSFLDVSTGEFLIAQGAKEYIDTLLQTFRPSEVLLAKNKQKQFFEFYGNAFHTYGFEEWVYQYDFCHDLLLSHFETNSLKGFGVDNMNHGIVAAGAVLHYLAETQHNKLGHITRVSRVDLDEYVWLDKFTIRNLELIGSTNENAISLLDVLDSTRTPMGSRMLKRWMLLPLKEKVHIEERLDIVEHFLANDEFSGLIEKHIKQIGDLERLISKVAVRKINPRELKHIRSSLQSLVPIKEACAASENERLNILADQMNNCELLMKKLSTELVEDPPVSVQKGHVIADGVSDALDALRQLLHHGKEFLAEIQMRESKNTGIPSLKIGYNSVFGYYLEVTNVHKAKVPEEWVRKQTLVNSERYITDELKAYEEKILGAEEKILALETTLFSGMVDEVANYIKPIQINADIIARLDVLMSFANNAQKNDYVRPKIETSLRLTIKEGRHPVIEKELPLEEPFISNDVFLDPEDQQIIIITGPNMSGKSVLLRQTALIVLMAQIGSFVPAKHAEIGLTDKIFTRVGASDNISSGESTFMVEMNETASILNNISDRSLILLDEIGRGTSTYDGISIAWAITEYLHEHPLHKPKVLFATHYHELIEMASSFPRIKNYHVSVKEVKNKILFLRKLVQGGSEHSFGIHVAKMAGMPNWVVDRANKILPVLEAKHRDNKHKETGIPKSSDSELQLSFIQLDDPLLQQIKEDILNTDVNTLTPVEALMKLNEIRKLLGKT